MDRLVAPLSPTRHIDEGTLDYRGKSLDDRTKDDLLGEARGIGIDGRSSTTKQQLIDAIRDHG